MNEDDRKMKAKADFQKTERRRGPAPQRPRRSLDAVRWSKKQERF